MKKRSILIAGFLTAALLGLGVTPWGMAVSQAERYVIAGIEARTGLKVTQLGRAEFALLPLPRVSLSDVAFADSERRFAGTAARVKARAHLLALMGGRLDFDRIELVAPTIDMAVASGPTDEIATWLSAPMRYLSDLPSQAKIVVTSGSVTARAAGSIRTVVRDLNLFVDDRTAGEPIVALGSLTWRGVPTEVSAHWPVGQAGGRLALAARSDLLTLKLEGTRSSGPEPVIAGELELAAADVSRALAWFGADARVASLVNSLRLTAETRISGDAVSLTAVRATLDGDRLDGALTIDNSQPRWALSGTLAGSSLDFGRLLTRAGLTASALAPGTPFDFDAWTAHDVDLRISVDSAGLGEARLRELAAQLMIRKGRFEAALLRARSYGGTVRTRLLATASSTSATPELRWQLGLDRVNLTQAAQNLPDWLPLTGSGTAQLSIESTGTTSDQILAGITGRASLSLRNGEILGLSLPELMRRGEREAFALRTQADRRTAFDTAQFAFSAQRGVLYLLDADLSASGFRANLSGQTSLTDRWLAASGALSPTSGPARQLGFDLSGTLSEPMLTLRPELQLSPTAADSAEQAPLRR